MTLSELILIIDTYNYFLVRKKSIQCGMNF